jgi:DNA-binding HxlR family transcriptional regulator
MTQKTCPITKTVTLLSDAWTMLVMRALTESPKRFCELERWLDGISTRTLTLKLKKLQAEGMLKKSNDGIYSATKKGMGLQIIEQAMITYSKLYLK